MALRLGQTRVYGTMKSSLLNWDCCDQRNTCSQWSSSDVWAEKYPVSWTTCNSRKMLPLGKISISQSISVLRLYGVSRIVSEWCCTWRQVDAVGTCWSLSEEPIPMVSRWFHTAVEAPMTHQSNNDDIISEHPSTLRMFGRRPTCPTTENGRFPPN